MATNVIGNVTHGEADKGPPVKAGGRYNATPPTLDDGDRSDLQVDSAGNLKTVAASSDPGVTHLATIAGAVGTEYETVAASQTDQVLGATGAAGDYLSGLLIVPATTSPGAVSLKDGAGAAITIFTGGASSVASLVPFFATILAKSTGGAWSVTTGANVSVIATGNFT